MNEFYGHPAGWGPELEHSSEVDRYTDPPHPHDIADMTQLAHELRKHKDVGFDKAVHIQAHPTERVIRFEDVAWSDQKIALWFHYMETTPEGGYRIRQCIVDEQGRFLHYAVDTTEDEFQQAPHIITNSMTFDQHRLDRRILLGTHEQIRRDEVLSEATDDEFYEYYEGIVLLYQSLPGKDEPS